jgi:hypothetical protein
MALRWSAQCLKFKAINMVFLRSTTPVVIRVANTFRAKPVQALACDVRIDDRKLKFEL